LPTPNLILTNARVLDPGRGIDQKADVAFADGKVAAIGADLPRASGAEVRDCAGLIVTPGLIDLHTHVYWGATSLGVEADPIARKGGCTTLVDAGSAGPGTLHGFRRFIVERSEVRILAYLNISYPGIYAFSPTVMVGECGDIRLLDLRECRRVVEENRDLVVGIKVRVGRTAGGFSGVEPLDMAIEVAEAVGLPVMAHIDYPPPSRAEVLSRLRPGDVLTHCFRPFPNATLSPTGGVRPEVADARARGVLFDVGHGFGSLGFESARGMIAAGFLPDAISSDVHTLSIDGPAHDLVNVMSKFLALGMTLEDVVRSSTQGPARALGRTDLGTLAAGGLGEATVLALEDGAFPHRDVLGETMTGRQRLVVKGIVRDGKWWHP
jgi:dihydroorotase